MNTINILTQGGANTSLIWPKILYCSKYYYYTSNSFGKYILLYHYCKTYIVAKWFICGETNSLYFPSKEFPLWTFTRGTVNKTICICINICNNNSIFYNNNNYTNVHFGFVQFQKVFRSWLSLTSWRVELLIWAFLRAPVHASTGARARASFSSVFVDERFINQAQFDAGFAHGLILKDGAVPAMKDPGRDSELQMISETASNVCFVGDWSKCSSLFSSTHLLELGCFRKLYLSFIIVIKLKTFWRYVILSVKNSSHFFLWFAFFYKK